MNEETPPPTINPLNLLIGLAGAFAGSWLTHALHLQNKTAQKADQVLGGQSGTAQTILNLLGGAAVQAGQAGLQHLVTNAPAALANHVASAPSAPSIPSAPQPAAAQEPTRAAAAPVATETAPDPVDPTTKDSIDGDTDPVQDPAFQAGVAGTPILQQ